MIVLGIDKGSTVTKSSTGQMINSTTREGIDLLKDSKLKVDIFGKSFVVGEKGNFSTDLMKAHHINTKILVYTMAALSTKEKDINLVVGLPIGLYSKQKEQMKILFHGQKQDLVINGKERTIHFRNCEVFPEAAGAFYTQQEKNCLIVDIGGLSVDTALFEEGKLQRYSTYAMGTMKLYSKIVNYINSQYDLSLTEWDIPKVLKQGITIYGNKANLDIGPLFQAHTLEIIERIKLEYDIKLLNVVLTGGGSILLENYIKRYIPQATRSGDQFDNVRGYKKIGEVVFG